MLNGYKLEPLCSFVVPGKPVPKQRIGINRGRPYLPKKTVDYQRRVAWAASGVLNIGKPPVASKGEPLYIRVVAVYDRPQYMDARKYPAARCLKTTRGDADNILKSVLDGIGNAKRFAVRLIDDDAQFVGCEVWKFYAERGGKARTEVEIFRLIDTAADV